MKTSLLAVVLLALASGCATSAGETPEASAPSADVQADAAALYARHCELCHGVRGTGDGFAAPFLFPPPRDFGTGRFRLVSTSNGAPTEDDLVAVLQRGLPGSAMPSFGWMEAHELAALARHVRDLAEEELARRLSVEARRAGRPLESSEARALARRRLTPGAALEVPAEPEPDPTVLARGRVLFEVSCAPCHGADGRGSDLAPHWTEDGSFAWARDFTAGVLEGGARHEAITRRVLAGLPGTSMPATQPESEQDLAALVAYVRSLIPPGAEERLVQHRETLVATRVPEVVPSDGDAPAWDLAEPVDVVLAPMEWGAEAVLRAELRALHDGTTVALRVRWHDPTRDQGQPLERAPVDAVSLALSPEARPPVFGMGSTEHPVNLWHWRADRLIDRAGALDLLENPPHVLRDPVYGESRADTVPLYLPAPAADQPTDEVRALRAHGAESLGEALSSVLEVRAGAAWEQGVWSVVFTRALVSGVEGAVPLRPGQDAQLALAIWNAAPPSGLARKSITLWHRLALQP